jgi:hypothetical protein
MRILKIIGWVTVPYIMIFVDWNELSRNKRIAAIAYISLILFSATRSPANEANTPPSRTDVSADSVASEPPPLPQQNVEEVAATMVPAPIQPTEVPPTEVPPTETPVPAEPIVLSGKGDAIEDFNWQPGAGLYRISGNACGQYFGVTSYDASGRQVELLVNATDPYNGVRPLDFGNTTTSRLEIKASCAWEISILPLQSVRTLSLPGEISGEGDDVVLLQGGTPDKATITGNASSRYFGVFSYGRSSYDVVVNTTEPYAGDVLIEGDTLLLEVKSEDSWTIAVQTR